VLDHDTEHGYRVPAFNVNHLGLRHGAACSHSNPRNSIRARP
jgi:hypothetical protein